MIVAVPVVEGMLHDRVLPAIERQGYEPEVIPTDPPPYPVVLARLFQRMQWKMSDLTIIEQDVESRTGAIESFIACPEPYCFHAYKFNTTFDAAGLDYAPLGHTRFRWAVSDHLRDLTQTDEWRVAGYCDLDKIIGNYLRTEGIEPHRHEGDVIHHHNYE
jgi:hypothetical protein